MSLASRTSLRTHFEVLGLGVEGQVPGLGLDASSPRKLACPRLEDSTIFELLKFCGDRLKNFCEDLFFWRALALVSLALVSRVSVLENAVLGLGLGFFCVFGLGLGLEPCVLDSTSDYVSKRNFLI